MHTCLDMSRYHTRLTAWTKPPWQGSNEMYLYN